MTSHPVWDQISSCKRNEKRFVHDEAPGEDDDLKLFWIQRKACFTARQQNNNAVMKTSSRRGRRRGEA